jgi:hypothetical protein
MYLLLYMSSKNKGASSSKDELMLTGLLLVVFLFNMSNKKSPLEAGFFYFLEVGVFLFPASMIFL